MIAGLWCIHEEETETSKDQTSCENQCAEFLVSLAECTKQTLLGLKESGIVNDNNDIQLLREKHINYLLSNISNLPKGFVSLDASRPWMIYWITHALHLLGKEASIFHDRIIDTLSHFQNPTGGFGGGPSQLSHGAPNFASVLTLCEIGTPQSLMMINRPAMYNYLLEMRVTNGGGGFTMHKDGEVDTRSCYTALVVARLLNLLTPELIGDTAEYLLQCQTYEGGFGGEPNNEAHGGYNFCALAGLLILQQGHRINIEGQRRWLVHMQTKKEGGFRGRTNKLVDSCYSYWQGAAFPVLSLIERGLPDIGDCTSIDNTSLPSQETHNIPILPCRCRAFMNSLALQKYILHCGQSFDGGLRDKPGKGRDFYHSCYSLSGLSTAQWLADEELHTIQIYGASDNLVGRTSCVFNINPEKVMNVINFFSHHPSSHEDLVAAYNSSQPSFS